MSPPTVENAGKIDCVSQLYSILITCFKTLKTGFEGLLRKLPKNAESCVLIASVLSILRANIEKLDDTISKAIAPPKDATRPIFHISLGDNLLENISTVIN